MKYLLVVLLLFVACSKEESPMDSPADPETTGEFFVGPEFTDKCWSCDLSDSEVAIRADQICSGLGYGRAVSWRCGFPCPATGETKLTIRHITCYIK